MNIGVHHLSQSDHYSSYFVQRDYGNLLIFSDALASIDHDFLKSRGGLYRQFIEDRSLISLAQCELFTTFGAAAVGKFNTESYHPKLKLERFGEEYSDHSIKFNRSTFGGQVLGLKQSDDKVAFIGRDFYLDEQGEVTCGNQKLGEAFFDVFEENQTSWLFFAHHAKNNHYLQL